MLHVEENIMQHTSHKRKFLVHERVAKSSTSHPSKFKWSTPKVKLCTAGVLASYIILAGKLAAGQLVVINAVGIEHYFGGK